MQVPGVTFLGIAELDVDHLRLAGLIDTLRQLDDAGTTCDQVVPVLQELADHTRQHFAREQEWMVRDNYPQVTEHEEQHRALLDVIDTIVGEYIAGRIQLDSRLLTDLWEWLNHHVRTADEEYADYIRLKPS